MEGKNRRMAVGRLENSINEIEQKLHSQTKQMLASIQDFDPSRAVYFQQNHSTFSN
jgi:hypothetical protein